MNKRLHIIPYPGLVIIFLLSLFIEGGCNNQADILKPTKSLFPLNAENAFISYIAKDVNLNLGITIEVALPVSTDKTAVNSVTFAVFNHSSETVTFSDEGFGLTIFRYDNAYERWEEVPLPHTPWPVPKTLPSKTEKWDMNIYNIWVILDNDLDAMPHEQLRFYVHGIGDTTYTKYGAYIDVKNPP